MIESAVFAFTESFAKAMVRKTQLVHNKTGNPLTFLNLTLNSLTFNLFTSCYQVGSTLLKTK